MKLRSLFVALFCVVATAACAQQNNFTIQRDKADIGVGSYTFEKAKNGYKVSSGYHIKMAPRPDTAHIRMGSTGTKVANAGSVVTSAPDPEDMQQEHSYTLDGDYDYLGGLIKNLNTEISNSYGLNKQRTQVTQNRIHPGKATISNQYPFDPDGYVLPVYDASVLQTLLYRVTTHPTTNGQYFLFVPVNDPETGEIQWAAQPDTTGTLDGKPVKLHRYNFLFGRHDYTVYADADNTLMEVEIHHPTVSLIRTGFILDTPPQ